MHHPEHRPAPEKTGDRRVGLLEEDVDAAGAWEGGRQFGAGERAEEVSTPETLQASSTAQIRGTCSVSSDACTNTEAPRIVPTTSAVAWGSFRDSEPIRNRPRRCIVTDRGPGTKALGLRCRP